MQPASDSWRVWEVFSFLESLLDALLKSPTVEDAAVLYDDGKPYSYIDYNDIENAVQSSGGITRHYVFSTNYGKDYILCVVVEWEGTLDALYFKYPETSPNQAPLKQASHLAISLAIRPDQFLFRMDTSPHQGHLKTHPYHVHYRANPPESFPYTFENLCQLIEAHI